MNEIQLTQGKTALVSDEDYELVNQYKWHANNMGGGIYYAFRRDGKTMLSMHRDLTNAPNGMEVDHINGNGLDNRRENLRICTHAQNRYNNKLRIDSTSGYKGVFWSKDSKKWQAQIQVDRKKIHLGFFSDPIDAARAYDNAAKEHHGEFCRTNF